MSLLYSALLGLMLAISSPWWLAQMLRHGKYRAGLWQRFGHPTPALKQPRAGKTIWLHAVSVGEALAMAGLVERLRREPELHVLVSTTTQTGQALARQRFGAESVFYFPLDFRFSIRRTLDVIRPDLVVLAETEFWPNFLAELRERKIPVAVVNARISDRSHPRYQRFRWLFRRALSGLSLAAAQSELDAERLREIGAPNEIVTVAGNVKFDAAPPAKDAPIVAALRKALADCSPIIVAGSTVDGEEPLVLDAYRQILARHPKAALLLAPRHKERFDAVAKMLDASGLAYARRSQMDLTRMAAIAPGGVLLLDSLGELAAVYSLGDLAFVGGSLARKGGHNILEPAYFGKPIFSGPHTENFRDIYAMFAREQAVIVAEADALGAKMLAVLDDAAQAQAMGERARQLLFRQQGATERTAQMLLKFLGAK